MGARDRGALHRAVGVTTVWSAGVAAVFAAAFGLLGAPFVDLMTMLPEVRETAKVFLPWMVAMPVVAIWAFQFDGVFLGATRTKALRNGMIASRAVLGGLTALLMPVWGNHGLWLALTGFMVMRSGLLVIRYPALARDLTD